VPLIVPLKVELVDIVEDAEIDKERDDVPEAQLVTETVLLGV